MPTSFSNAVALLGLLLAVLIDPTIATAGTSGQDQTSGAEVREEISETLQQQRTDIAEWYGGLIHSSAKAWEEIKQGIAKSYSALEKSLEKAREDF